MELPLAICRDYDWSDLYVHSLAKPEISLEVLPNVRGNSEASVRAP